MVFHRRLSDCKSAEDSKTLLSILAVFNNAVAWMVSTRSPTSKSSRPFNKSLVTVPKAPITIGIIITVMSNSFFQVFSKIKVLISLFTFFQFYSVVCRDSKVDNFADFFILLIFIRSVFGPRLVDLFVYQSPIGFCACHFLGLVLGCAYTIC